MEQRICHCGSVIESTGRGRPRKYCLRCLPRKRELSTRDRFSSCCDATVRNKTEEGVSSLPSLSESMTAGTIAALEALRDAIAADLDVCDSMRDRASLYLRLADTLNRIEELKPPEVSKGDDVDEIAARRAARRAVAAKGSSRPKRSG